MKLISNTKDFLQAVSFPSPQSIKNMRFGLKAVFILLPLCGVSGLVVPVREAATNPWEVPKDLRVASRITLKNSVGDYDYEDVETRKFVREPEPTISARNARIIGPLGALMTPIFGVADQAFAASSAENFNAALRNYFPGSLSNSELAYRITETLRLRGYSEMNTLIGSSFCSDEINDTSASLAAVLAQKLGSLQVGGVFNLGGLGGLPFVGTSGFGAFASHCPTNGKIVIVFGPHVGISNDGVVGKVERIGKSNPSTSCGAAVGAYKALLAGTVDFNAKPGTTDFQEEYIIQNLKNKLGVLADVESRGNDDAIAFVTRQMYQLVWEIVRDNVEKFTSQPGFWDKCSEVTLLGGILVNRGHGDGLIGGDDLFQPLLLTTVAAAGETNIYGDVFGDLKTPKSNVASGFDRTKIKEVRGADFQTQNIPADKSVPAPAPVAEKANPVPSPVAQKPVPAPVAEKATPVPSPVAQKPVPAPVAEKITPVPSPVAQKPVPAPVEQKPVATTITPAQSSIPPQNTVKAAPTSPSSGTVPGNVYTDTLSAKSPPTTPVTIPKESISAPIVPGTPNPVKSSSVSQPTTPVDDSNFSLSATDAIPATIGIGTLAAYGLAVLRKREVEYSLKRENAILNQKNRVAEAKMAVSKAAYDARRTNIRGDILGENAEPSETSPGMSFVEQVVSMNAALNGSSSPPQAELNGSSHVDVPSTMSDPIDDAAFSQMADEINGLSGSTEEANDFTHMEAGLNGSSASTPESPPSSIFRGSYLDALSWEKDNAANDDFQESIDESKETSESSQMYAGNNYLSSISSSEAANGEKQPKFKAVRKVGGYLDDL